MALNNVVIGGLDDVQTGLPEDTPVGLGRKKIARVGKYVQLVASRFGRHVLGSIEPRPFKMMDLNPVYEH